ncbi:Permease [Staphylococcus lugdunensis]|jgi:uncharacterized membrane protein|uniref:DUF1361 domain-containing protein n=2 Tax=Staphylococcus TaxID=1279 RepID=A0A133Q1E9_STALU|nr:DUF1361 domain-containing protein [Staphylococcus lugdunensis]EFU84407.1 hypothetical protein HMPREF0790_1034 [Staphylococcus lugdunensis M23590]EKS21623.1 hypothetical protein HMPREF9308_02199 [Staphylococcus lugdunensis ACS-027-V-Sch2]EVI51393.1 hypothetical protein T979_00977 [Staphylococcus lugdunensis UCIM6116]AST59414.2 DUF1361 domain-containing protein [Staphylococcus lugdunensis]
MNDKFDTKVVYIMQGRYIARIYFIILIVISLFESRIFEFMTLNIFLAYIPFELCLLLKLFKPKKVIEWPLFIIFSLIFLLMVPNTFYMVTDLIHLNQFTFNFYLTLNLMEWIFFTYLLLGVFFALYCMTLIYLELYYFTSHQWINIILVAVVMFLSGLGIYIGRFLRFHSVFLINQPFKIIENVVSSLSGKSLIFILLMVVLQATLFIFAKGVRHTQ